MWTLIIYFGMHLLVTAEINVKHFVSNDDKTDSLDRLAKCIKIISVKELSFAPTVAIDVHHIKDPKKKDKMVATVVNELTKYKIPTMIITNETSKALENRALVIQDTIFGKNYTRHTLFVTFFENCNDFALFDFNNINEEIKYLITCETSSDDCIEQLEIIQHYVDKYDIMFMFLDNIEDRNKMISFIPKFDETTCKLTVEKPTHINTCFNGTLLRKEIYPSKKPLNLNKCPLRVGMATLYPFSIIRNKDQLKNYDPINESIGSDIITMKIIAGYFNASLELYYIFRKEENPYVDYEFLNYLINGSLDMCAGGLYRIYGDVVGYSGIYVKQAVTWIYYAKRGERSWENLIGKLRGFYIFVIFYVSYSISWYFICVFDGTAVSPWKMLLYSLGSLGGTTSIQDPRSMKQKILNIMYLVMCVYFAAYISIVLYAFLTIMPPPQMFNTIDEIMHSGRVPYLVPKTKYFINDPKYLQFANTSADCGSFMDCSEKTFNHNGLTVVLQSHFYDFQAKTAVDGEARILKPTENILTVYNEMLVRKDIPLVKKVYQVVQNLFEAGITKKLFDEAIGVLTIAKADSANSKMVKNSYSCRAGCAITFMQIAGVFYVWIFGCLLSCIAFIIEICI